MVGAAIASAVLVAALAGARPSPLSPPLPAGAGPIAPLRSLSSALGLDGLPRSSLGVVSLACALLVVAAFVGLAVESWKGSISTRTVVWLAIGLHALVLVMPLIGSRDVFSYALYGRIVGVYHANPFAVTPRAFMADPFARFVDPQWLDTPPVYGPAFLWLAALLTRWVQGPGAVIGGFKVVAVVANLTTLALVVRLVGSLRPRRTAFVAVMIGANPAVVFGSVAGGHVDPILALGVAAALSYLHRPTGVPRSARRELIATGILATCAMVKFVAMVPLAFVVAVAVARAPLGRRWATLGKHVLVAGLVGVVGYGPFFQTHDLTFGLAYLFPYQSVLAPMSFVRDALIGLVGGGGDPAITLAVRLSFAAGFLAITLRLVRFLTRRARGLSLHEESAAWGWSLLLVSLSFQWLYPWYLVWFALLAWALPRHARWAAVALSAALPLAATFVDDRVVPTMARSMARLDAGVLAPALLVLLCALALELWRRLGSGRITDLDGPAPSSSA